MEIKRAKRVWRMPYRFKGRRIGYVERWDMTPDNKCPSQALFGSSWYIIETETGDRSETGNIRDEAYRKLREAAI